MSTSALLFFTWFQRRGLGWTSAIRTVRARSGYSFRRHGSDRQARVKVAARIRKIAINQLCRSRQSRLCLHVIARRPHAHRNLSVDARNLRTSGKNRRENEVNQLWAVRRLSPWQERRPSMRRERHDNSRPAGEEMKLLGTAICQGRSAFRCRNCRTERALVRISGTGRGGCQSAQWQKEVKRPFHSSM